MIIVTVAGNLGGDAELRSTQSGINVCSFSVAGKSGYGDREQTVWVRCSLWGNRAESLVGHLKKGTPVAVYGELSTSEWTTPDGGTRFSVECNVRDVKLMGKSPMGDSQSALVQSGGNDSDDFDDDAPF
jgi:single-strand DNA-binding protein